MATQRVDRVIAMLAGERERERESDEVKDRGAHSMENRRWGNHTGREGRHAGRSLDETHASISAFRISVI